MRNLFNRQFEMLLRLSAFGRRHADLFPPASLAGQMFEVITSTLPELSKSAGSQAAGFAVTREGSVSRAEARAVLLDCLDAISLTARAIGREQPAVRVKFQIRRSRSDQGLIDAARAFAENAAPIKDQFEAHAMDPAFIQEMEAAIRGFEEAITNHVEARGSQASATACLENVMQRAMDAAYRLDGIVPNKAKKDPVLLKEWENTRRVARARVSSKPAEPEPSAGAPAQT